MFGRAGWSVVIGGVALCPCLFAQDLVIALDGDVAFEHFGQAVAALGDVNGDGVADFVVGSPRASSAIGVNTGRVRVFSGVDQTVLFDILGATPTEELGFSVSGAADVDLDGFPDILVGAPFLDHQAMDAGAARVYSGVDGQALLEVVGAFTNRTLGFSVACAGDIDFDGVPELLLGSPGGGQAKVVSGADGATKYTLSFTGSDFHGTSVAGGGDVNGDGTPDMLVTASLAPVGGQTGGLRAYSGVDASVLMTLTSPAQLGPTGNSCAFLGDLDFDGKDEIALGSWVAPSALVFSGGSGQLLYQFQGSAAPGMMDDVGFSIANCGDQDGDGVSDFAIGAPSWTDASGADVGLVRVVSGIDGALLGQITGDASNDDLGYAIVGTSDFNSDGLPDLLIGAPLDDDGGTNAGRAFLAAAIDETIAAPVILLGDLVAGVTSPAAKTHAYSFLGLGSSLMKLKAKPTAGGVPGGGLAVSIAHKTGGPKWTWSNVSDVLEYKLPSDGEYELRVWGQGFTFGAYSFKTNRKLPDLAKSQKLKLIAKPSHFLPFIAMPGAFAKFVVKPEWKKSQYDVELLDPDGATVDLSSGVMNRKGVYKASAIQLTKIGVYQLRLTGFQFAKEKMKVTIDLQQPKGTGVVSWPG